MRYEVHITIIILINDLYVWKLGNKEPLWEAKGKSVRGLWIKLGLWSRLSPSASPVRICPLLIPYLTCLVCSRPSSWWTAGRLDGMHACRVGQTRLVKRQCRASKGSSAWTLSITSKSLKSSSCRPNQLYVLEVQTAFGSRAFRHAALAVSNGPSEITCTAFTRNI